MASTLTVDTIVGATAASKVHIPGGVVQVVSANYSTMVSSDSTTWVDTGLSCAITPKFSNSKIMILVDQNGRVESNWMGYKLLRNAVSIKTAQYYLYDSNSTNNSSISFNFLDSPNTISQITYKTQFMRAQYSNNVKVNDNVAPATILLMEIAQ
jgi:hypothetical protein